jgi:hypothetical protein
MSPFTCTGLVEFAVSPLPSWPNSFEPQHSTVFVPAVVALTAQVWATPAVIVVAHVTATLILAPAVLPLAFAPSVQVWPAGCVNTVTAYAAPLAIGVLKLVATPLAETVRLSLPLSCSTTAVFASNPETVTATFELLPPQAIAMLDTLAFPIFPLPFVIAQLGVGCASAVTA